MPLTRDFKQTIMARVKSDPDFRAELIVESTNALLEGDIDTGKSLLKDYLNATESFADVAKQLEKSEKSIRRMLGPQGNPTLSNFIGILKTCTANEHLHLQICSVE